MISLSEHIEILLLEHDCIVVPGLGGFIANHAVARYSENGDGLFLPPYRVICFNENLQANDGLLVQSYMQAYDASYPDALRQLEMDVEDVVNELDLKGEYEFKGIGTLRKQLGGNITFEAFEAGVLTPSLYGLYSYDVKTVAELVREREIQKALSSTSISPVQTVHSAADIVGGESEISVREEKEHVVIKLHRSWVDLAVAAVFAGLLFSLFYFPAVNSIDKTDVCEAGAVHVSFASVKDRAKMNNIKNRVATAMETSKEQQDAEAEESSASPAETEKSGNAETAADMEKDNLKNFSIVLASSVSKANADEFVDNLAKKGLNDAHVLETKSMRRVLYSYYATSSDAYKALKDLKKKSSHFSDAWVIELK